MRCYNSYVEIDFSKVCKNIQTIETELGPRVQVIPVLKCDAYGLGLVPAAQAIATGTGVRMFAVAQVGEAALLREAGIGQDILVLSGAPQAHFPLAMELGIQLCAYSVQMIEALGAEAARQGRKTQVQLKIDTGLNRLGPHPGEELAQVLEALKRQPWLEVTGAYSHFVDGEVHGSPLARQQLALYRQALHQVEAAGFPAPLRHLSASGATDWLPEAHFNAVRIGRRLQMDCPGIACMSDTPTRIEEAASWRAQIVHLRPVRPGDTVGYDGAFRVEQPGTVAVISVGYGDGLDERMGPARAPLLVGAEGHPARYLSVCMDQAVVDVTGIPCRVGDEVTVFGHASGGAFLSAQKAAASLGHEGVYLTSRLGLRVERRYVG